MTELYVHIVKGQISNPPKVRQAFNLPDGTYRITIAPYKKRTLKQNDYYWGSMLPLVLEGLRNNGYSEVKTVEDAHEVLKHLFLKRNVVQEGTGEVIATIGGSTAGLSTVEFAAFIEEVIKWGFEYLGVTIPGPGEPLLMFTEPK